MTTSVRLSDVVASVFAGVWRSIKAHEFTHYWFKGGRNSTKSSFISIAIVLLIMLNPEANAVVLRKVGNTLRTSVYEQIGWACDVLGVAHLFDFGLSPMEEDIIGKHMWPLTAPLPYYKESYMVSLADKICATLEMAHLYGLLGVRRNLRACRPALLRRAVL